MIRGCDAELVMDAFENKLDTHKSGTNVTAVSLNSQAAKTIMTEPHWNTVQAPLKRQSADGVLNAY